jgi:hypothetical protein
MNTDKHGKRNYFVSPAALGEDKGQRRKDKGKRKKVDPG